MQFLPRFVAELRLSSAVEQYARAHLEQDETPEVRGSKPAGVAGGAILVTLRELGGSEGTRQADVADAAGVSVPTVRRYRDALLA